MGLRNRIGLLSAQLPTLRTGGAPMPVPVTSMRPPDWPLRSQPHCQAKMRQIQRQAIKYAPRSHGNGRVGAVKSKS